MIAGRVILSPAWASESLSGDIADYCMDKGARLTHESIAAKHSLPRRKVEDLVRMFKDLFCAEAPSATESRGVCYA